MRIDAHQHFWIYNDRDFGWVDDSMAVLRRDYLPGDLSPLLDEAGFDGCIAVQAAQSVQETEFLLDLASRHPFIKGVVGWVDLRSESVGDDLGRLSENPLFVGVRHIVQAEPDGFLLDSSFQRGVRRLAEFGLTYDILIFPRQLEDAFRFASAIPEVRFVVDHCAKPDIRSGEIDHWRAGMEKLAGMPNVYCKLSGLVTEADWGSWTVDQLAPYAHAVLEAFGAERVMIGSDWPVCLLGGSYGEVIGAYLKAAGFPEEENGRLAGGAATSFYGLRAR